MELKIRKYMKKGWNYSKTRISSNKVDSESFDGKLNG